MKIVIEAVCIMHGKKPKKVAGEKMGTKVDDYWEPGRALLQDPVQFLNSLYDYDKVSCDWDHVFPHRHPSHSSNKLSCLWATPFSNTKDEGVFGLEVLM